MREVIRLSLRFQFLLIILAAAFLVFGIGQLRHMPVDVYPEFNPPLVEVQTEALGLSASEVESLITVPMEADLLNGIAWLEQIYSESVTGLSSILLVFEPGTDPIAARQMVQERLTQAFALPNVSKPPTMLQPLSATSRVMMVGLSSDNLSLIEMGVLARWNIKPRLMGVNGVANVAIWGQRERQLQVLVDPKKLLTHGVTLSEIIQTTGEALWFSPLSFLESSSPGTAGWIDTPNQRLSIRHELPISSPNDLDQVSVVGKPGLLLGDLAEVVEDHQPLIGDAILESGPGLLLVIEKFPGANTLEVTRGVEEALSAMRPGLAGINIDTNIFRPANYIELAMSNLTKSLFIMTILVVLVFSFFYWQWRSVLLSLVTITLSIVTAVWVLYLRGVTFNAMILAGLIIALGVIIDDTIVDVENIVRRLTNQHKKYANKLAKNSPALNILEAMLETRSPIIFATLIILLLVLPIFFIKDLSGAFFQPLAESYVVAIISSMVVALIVTPALGLTLFSNKKHQHRKSPLLVRLEKSYKIILGQLLKTPQKAYITILIVVMVGLGILPFLKLSLLPSFKQTDLLIEWEAVPGTSRTEMNRITAQVSQELNELDGVENVGAHVGRAITGDAIVGINSAELWVNLNPMADYEATLKTIGDVIGGYPGLFREVSPYQPERIGEVLMDNDEDLVVRVYGYELEVLKSLAQDVSQILSETEGVSNARAEIQIEEPQVEIEVNLAAAERNQVKPGDVRRQAATLLSGLQVGNLYEEQKVFDVVVWGIPEIRNSLTDIEKLVIETPRGNVPMGELAEVRIVPAPIIIKRDAVSRFVDVEADIDGRSIASVHAEVRDRLKKVEFPLEYHAEVVGAYGDKETTRMRVLGVGVVALLGIFLLMQASFTSWRLAFIAFLILPISLVGGILAVFIDGGILSLGSLVGFLTVLGIAARHSILLINHFQHLEGSEGETFGLKLVMAGAQERLAPVMMTTLTLGFALLPLVFFADMAGFEIAYPTAIVILGGILTSAFLNLFIIPALYLRLGTKNSKVMTKGAANFGFMKMTALGDN